MFVPTASAAATLAAIPQADLDRFARHLAQAVAGWHRSHCSDDVVVELAPPAPMARPAPLHKLERAA